MGECSLHTNYRPSEHEKPGEVKSGYVEISPYPLDRLCGLRPSMPRRH